MMKSRMIFRKLSTQNHYQLIGVNRDADRVEIHKAYLQMAKQYHPDLNPEPEATKKFHEIHKAYKILQNPKTKEEYDKTLPKVYSKPASKNKYTGAEKISVEDIADYEEELRKSLEEWEMEKHGFTYSKKSWNYKDRINTNLSANDYGEWHEWSHQFQSHKHRTLERKGNIEYMTARNVNATYTDSFYDPHDSSISDRDDVVSSILDKKL